MAKIAFASAWVIISVFALAKLYHLHLHPEERHELMVKICGNKGVHTDSSGNTVCNKST
jgi:hypothetical protein